MAEKSAPVLVSPVYLLELPLFPRAAMFYTVD